MSSIYTCFTQEEFDDSMLGCLNSYTPLTADSRDVWVFSGSPCNIEGLTVPQLQTLPADVETGSTDDPSEHQTSTQFLQSSSWLRAAPSSTFEQMLGMRRSSNRPVPYYMDLSLINEWLVGSSMDRPDSLLSTENPNLEVQPRVKIAPDKDVSKEV